MDDINFSNNRNNDNIDSSNENKSNNISLSKNYMNNLTSKNLTESEKLTKLKLENENQKNEIIFLKSKINRYIYETKISSEKYINEICKLKCENQNISSSLSKISEEKEKYINTVKLLQIKNNKYQNELILLKEQIENYIKNESVYKSQILNLIKDVQKYETSIQNLTNQIKEKATFENMVGELVENTQENCDLNKSINGIEQNFYKILTQSQEFQKGKIIRENKVYNNLRNLIDELNQLKILVNNKNVQIQNGNVDKLTLIDCNKKLNKENKTLKIYINKLLSSLDLCINENHSAVKKIFELENIIKQYEGYQECSEN